MIEKLNQNQVVEKWNSDKLVANKKIKCTKCKNFTKEYILGGMSFNGEQTKQCKSCFENYHLN